MTINSKRCPICDGKLHFNASENDNSDEDFWACDKHGLVICRSLTKEEQRDKEEEQRDDTLFEEEEDYEEDENLGAIWLGGSML